MIRRKALAVAALAAAVTALTLAVLLSTSTPATSHPGYTWQPGCHCGAPTTTTATKTTTTTTKKPTTTTAASTTTSTQTATISTSTTTTTLATTTTLTTAGVALVLDTKPSSGIPNDPKTMEAGGATAIGLALSSDAQPPDRSGPAGGSPEGGVPTGTDEAVTGDAPAEDPAAVDTAAVYPAAAGLGMIPPQYFVSPVAILFLLIYATSFILYRTKSIRVATHRKIWNLLLMATFLITGALGVVLAIGISHDPPWLLPRSLLFWHVETGILMSFASFFHLGWHLRYYLAMVIGRGRATRTPWGSATARRSR
jgi:hypothetical protein